MILNQSPTFADFHYEYSATPPDAVASRHTLGTRCIRWPQGIHIELNKKTGFMRRTKNLFGVYFLQIKVSLSWVRLQTFKVFIYTNT